jgi:hypothetical protein
MPEENIESAVEQIAETYGACRYLDGVTAGAEAVSELGSQEAKESKGNHIYSLELTKRQAELLSYACDQFSRLIEGQDWTYAELFEEAWERRCKEATGKPMDDEFDGGWHIAREDAEMFAKQIKRRFWGLEPCAMFGIHYDDTSDILFDIHQSIRHQLWLDKPEDKKSHITVDADEPMRFGSEPLAKIKRKKQ